MDTNRIMVGMIIKNYKELCILLGLIALENNSKKAQIKEMERYFSFTKQGQKIIINEIYDEVKDKLDNRKNGNNKTPYIQCIEKLILDLLVQDLHKEKVCLSKNKLFKELKMINENYAFCKSRIPKLSKFTNIEKETIEEWYLSADSTLKSNVERALDNLKGQSLIIWSNEISVCKMEVVNNGNGIYDIDKKVTLDQYDEEIIEFKVNAYTEYNFREATDSEKKFIIHTERDIMKKMGYESKQTIVRCGAWDSFKKKINKIILKELNIDFYYNSYKILFNEDHILEKYEELEDLLLTKEERENRQSELNMSIVDRLQDNIEKKQNRAIEETKNWFGNFRDDKLKRRVKDNYLDDNEKLIETLINKNSKSIKKVIKKTKIES